MSNPMNTQVDLKRIHQLIQTGDQEQAQKLIVGILKADPQNADAWYIASLVMPGNEQKIRMLARALAINPQYTDAQQRLAQLLAPEVNDPWLPAAAPVRVPAKKSSGLVSWIGIVAAIVAFLCLGIIGGGLLVSTMGGIELSQIVFGSPTPTLTPTPTSTPTPTLTPTPTSTPFPTMSSTLPMLAPPASTEDINSLSNGYPPQSTDLMFGDIPIISEPAAGLTLINETLIANQESYHAEFHETGVFLLVRESSSVPGASALFYLAQLRRGDMVFYFPPPLFPDGSLQIMQGWLIRDNVVVRPRGSNDFLEIGIAKVDEFELAYLLRAMPLENAKGDLEIIVGLQTDLETHADSEGVFLANQDGNGISIGPSAATDTNGNSITVKLEPDDDGFRIVVPGDWLANAAYPVFIDHQVAAR